MSYIKSAFELICTEAKETDPHYVVLVSSVQCYGGPEEGGWWYTRQYVEEYQLYPTKEMAEKVAKEVEKSAEELKAMARRSHGDLCLNQLEWLEARGLDADYLPENDGPTEYEVLVTNEIPVFDNRKPEYC